MMLKPVLTSPASQSAALRHSLGVDGSVPDLHLTSFSPSISTFPLPSRSWKRSRLEGSTSLPAAVIYDVQNEFKSEGRKS